MTSATRFAPAFVLLAGAVFTIYLQTLVTEEVFFSCDGGIKFILTKQFATRGLHDMRVDLDLRPEPWVRQLWLDGLHPLAEPFAYRRGDRWYMQYPPFFAIASAPFYRLLGFRGLYVLPLVTTWLLWLVFYVACRRAGIAIGSACLGLIVLIFASPTTLYSAMYWEHAPALLLSFVGASWLWAGGAGRAWSAIAGLCAGLAGWLRPESLFVAIGLAAMAVVWRRGPDRSRTAAVFAAAILVAAAGFCAWNMWTSGSPLGFHGIQAMDDPGGHLRGGPQFLWSYLYEMAYYFPLALVMLAAFALRRVRARLGPGVCAMLLLCVSLFIALPFIFPNDGGKQWGPRYLFFLVPATIAASVKLLQCGTPPARVAWGAVLVAALGWGARVNTIRGAHEIDLDYRFRVLPDLQALRALPEKVVITNSVFFSSELSTTFDSRAWFRLSRRAALDVSLGQVAAQMRHHGERRAVFLLDSMSNFPTEVPVDTPDGHMRFRVYMRNAPGTFFRAELVEG